MRRPIRAVIGRGGEGEVVGGVGARAVARGGVGGCLGQFLFGDDGSDFGFVGSAYSPLLGVFAHQATVRTSFAGWVFAAALLGVGCESSMWRREETNLCLAGPALLACLSRAQAWMLWGAIKDAGRRIEVAGKGETGHVPVGGKGVERGGLGAVLAVEVKRRSGIWLIFECWPLGARRRGEMGDVEVVWYGVDVLALGDSPDVPWPV